MNWPAAMGSSPSFLRGAEPPAYEEPECAWLNSLMKGLWPALSLAAQERIASAILPEVQAHIPSDLNVTLEAFSLGSQAPELQSIRVSRDDVSISLHLQIRWVSDESITIRCCELPFGISDLSIIADLSVRLLPLLSEAPVVGGIHFTFSSAPVLNFNLTGVPGALVSMMPKIQGVLQSAITKALCDAMLSPNGIFLHWLSLKQMMTIDICELQYPVPSAVIRLGIVEVRGIRPTYGSMCDCGAATCDSFASISIGSQKFPTLHWGDECWCDVLLHSQRDAVQLDLFRSNWGPFADKIGSVEGLRLQDLLRHPDKFWPLKHAAEEAGEVRLVAIPLQTAPIVVQADRPQQGGRAHPTALLSVEIVGLRGLSKERARAASIAVVCEGTSRRSKNGTYRNMNKELGTSGPETQRLVEFMLAQGLSMDEIAASARVDRGAIEKIARFSPSFCTRFEQALHFPVCDLNSTVEFVLHLDGQPAARGSFSTMDLVYKPGMSSKEVIVTVWDKVSKQVPAELKVCLTLQKLQQAGVLQGAETREPETGEQWFNWVLKELWPHCGKGLAAEIKQHIEPSIQAALPHFLRSVCVADFMPGSCPPQLGPISISTTDQGTGIALRFRFMWKWNGSLLLEHGLLASGITDLTVKGRMNVLLQPLMPSMPVVKGIHMFMEELPEFDWHLTGLAEGVPGLHCAIHDAMSQQLSELLVTPNRLFLNLLNPLEDPFESFNVVAHTSPPPALMLRLGVIEARQLRAGDDFLGSKTSDPYVVVSIGDRTFRTPTVSRTCDPHWGHEGWCDFLVYFTEQLVRVQVFDADWFPGSADNLGKLINVRVKDLLACPDKLWPLHSTEPEGEAKDGVPLERGAGFIRIKVASFTLSQSPRQVPRQLSIGRACHTAVLVATLRGLQGPRGAYARVVLECEGSLHRSKAGCFRNFEGHIDGVELNGETQRLVALLASKGYTSNQIADASWLSIPTVKLILNGLPSLAIRFDQAIYFPIQDERAALVDFVVELKTEAGWSRSNGQESFQVQRLLELPGMRCDQLIQMGQHVLDASIALLSLEIVE